MDQFSWDKVGVEDPRGVDRNVQLWQRNFRYNDSNSSREAAVSKAMRMTNADEKKRVGVHTCRVHTDIRYRTPGADGSYIHSRIRVNTHRPLSATNAAIIAAITE